MPQLLAGLALGGLIGIPGVATALVALATVGTWSRGFFPAAGALAGAVLGVLTCVVLSKVVTTATASLAASRRFKDISGVVFMVPLILLGPIVAGIAKASPRLPPSCRTLPGLSRGRPLGAAWSLGGDADAGLPGAAGLKLLIAVATLAGLSWCWKILLRTGPGHPAVRRRRQPQGRKAGMFAILPPTPTGAVTARALTYWLRDPRYGGSLVVIPLLAVVMFFQASQGDSFGDPGDARPADRVPDGMVHLG